MTMNLRNGSNSTLLGSPLEACIAPEAPGIVIPGSIWQKFLHISGSTDAGYRATGPHPVNFWTMDVLANGAYVYSLSSSVI